MIFVWPCSKRKAFKVVGSLIFASTSVLNVGILFFIVQVKSSDIINHGLFRSYRTILFPLARLVSILPGKTSGSLPRTQYQWNRFLRGLYKERTRLKNFLFFRTTRIRNVFQCSNKCSSVIRSFQPSPGKIPPTSPTDGTQSSFEILTVTNFLCTENDSEHCRNDEDHL